ncbi:hypothetical protein CERZMDRAFT_88531 [Cercospora zeae-maydis SCOH1-5]|uniref:Uncharacterized protein n=1 Tax=Cercospora zeae-maydis SCOH1-5 TaxID=717836 RepID=A0A6A6F195_9PEZI|nr:hypothetical protein CERZMDRAFT_88531 [Cercospora zeae-maydis SCOH1-5]
MSYTEDVAQVIHVLSDAQQATSKRRASIPHSTEPYQISSVVPANSSHVSGDHELCGTYHGILAICADTLLPLGNFTSPPFWGCCTSPACSSDTGCASTALAGAFLTTNPSLAEPFLSLNETWEASDAGNTEPSPDSDTEDSGGGTNTGAIAGGVVGGVVALAAVLFGVIWMLRRHKRRAAAAAASSAPAAHAGKPGVPELSHDASTSVALKQLPGHWQTSPSVPSYHNSPEFQNGEWSPRPPSYFTHDPRVKPQHMSYELPGSQAGVEMDAIRTEQERKPPSSPAA